jgi:hypothetical protein
MCDILKQFFTSSTPKNERDKDKKFVGLSYCFQMIKGPERSVPETNFDFSITPLVQVFFF